MCDPDPGPSRKRLRRNALRPNSQEMGILRDFSLIAQLDHATLRIDDHAVAGDDHSNRNIASRPPNSIAAAGPARNSSDGIEIENVVLSMIRKDLELSPVNDSNETFKEKDK